MKMTFAKITDGSSKTLLASEKWVHTSLYLGDINGQADDRGWSDGWDFDPLRRPSSGRVAMVKTPHRTVRRKTLSNYLLGSAHPGGLNALFGDGSVTGIGFDVDLETLNRLGHRSDGETITQSF